MDLVVIGGSDAGISAGLRARELDPTAQVTLVVADAYPNFSICGIPYCISGDATDWRHLVHRTRATLDATGLQVRTDTRATRIDLRRREVTVTGRDCSVDTLGYDALIVGTGAVPVTPPISGLTGPDALGPADGVHLLHGPGRRRHGHLAAACVGRRGLCGHRPPPARHHVRTELLAPATPNSAWSSCGR